MHFLIKTTSLNLEAPDDADDRPSTSKAAEGKREASPKKKRVAKKSPFKAQKTAGASSSTEKAAKTRATKAGKFSF